LVYFAPWLTLDPDAAAFMPSGIPTLREAADIEAHELSRFDAALAERRRDNPPSPNEEAAWSRWRESLLQVGKRARDRLSELSQLASRCAALADVELDFLYDKSRHLLSIGYNASNHRLDTSFYDLLASEARFGSYIAISQDKLPQEHWFAMSRALT